MAFPMPPAPRLNAEFYWECPTCRRAFARPETAARCHRPPEGDPPTVAAPLVRSLELAMFDGHPLALTGWLEADQAELTVLHRPEDGGALEGHRLPLLRLAGRPGAHGCLRVRPRLKRPAELFWFRRPGGLGRRDSRTSDCGASVLARLRIEFLREEMLALYPLEAFMFSDRSNLNWAANRRCTPNRVLNKSDGRLNKKPS
jgi:hypothetical protein